ncbi:MAG: four helix bundle protein [Bacteroidota bacterium]|nr:four helix bundle protein [Bacteroidota bacterium]
MTVGLEKLEVYQLAEMLADLVWDICIDWEWFAKDTVGKQLVKAADSVGANIAEGYGRYAFKENIQFCYYARGSLMKVKHFLRRAKKRKLLNSGQVSALKEIIQPLAPKLNAYIRSIKIELNRSKQMTNDH